jgi:transmembrane sensor
MLNTDTRVSWRFADRRDFWIEQGEAALFVRETERAFRLYGVDFDAHLDGGRFDIRLAGRGGQLMVLAGQAVATYRGALAGTIGAGSALTMNNGVTRVAALGSDAIGAATAWQSGRIVFNGMPLDRALAEFNRYLPDKIVLGQRDLGATLLGGEFRVDDPDTFLLALREAFDIDHRRQGDHILLFRGR